MPFRLRRDARDWFKDIQRSFDIEFDVYYLCFIAGVTERRKAEVPTSGTSELVDYFPGSYKSKGRTIVSLFLSREVAAQGIALTERAALHNAIRKLVDPLSPSHLSDEGMKEFNKYSYGGFEVLTEWFPDDRPRAIETFLPLYWQKLRAIAE